MYVYIYIHQKLLNPNCPRISEHQLNKKREYIACFYKYKRRVVMFLFEMSKYRLKFKYFMLNSSTGSGILTNKMGNETGFGT